MNFSGAWLSFAYFRSQPQNFICEVFCFFLFNFHHRNLMQHLVFFFIWSSLNCYSYLKLLSLNGYETGSYSFAETCVGEKRTHHIFIPVHKEVSYSASQTAQSTKRKKDLFQLMVSQDLPKAQLSPVRLYTFYRFYHLPYVAQMGNHEACSIQAFRGHRWKHFSN